MTLWGWTLAAISICLSGAVYLSGALVTGVFLTAWIRELNRRGPDFAIKPSLVNVGLPILLWPVFWGLAAVSLLPTWRMIRQAKARRKP